MNLTWRQVRRWRIRRQLLLSPAVDAIEVARALGGIHAQVTSCSALIAGIRRGGPADLAHGLVRTWAARGTLHLLPADELDLWIGALTARDARRRFPPSWEREHGVTATQLHAITDAIGAVLGATPLTRAQLVAAVVAELGDPAIAGPLATGWGALLKPAAARGLLCSGPPAGDGAVTFVSPGPLSPWAAEEAEPAVLARFLAANGPATAVDVGRWWGEQPAPARRMIRAADDAVTPVEVDGEAGYVVRAEDVDELAATPDGGTDPADAPLLLPGFDPWVISPLSHRTRAVPEGRMPEVSRTAGWISPVLVTDGLVAGVWEHDGPAITVRPFDPLPPRTRAAVERAAARYRPLLGPDPVTVTWA